jgi:hypothetical protein
MPDRGSVLYGHERSQRSRQHQESLVVVVREIHRGSVDATHEQ